MAKLNAKILAAVTLAAVTLTTPALSYANDFAGNSQYDFCKQADGENQLLGGLVGAVAGGVIGSQVAGRGDRTAQRSISPLISGLSPPLCSGRSITLGLLILEFQAFRAKPSMQVLGFKRQIFEARIED